MGLMPVEELTTAQLCKAAKGRAECLLDSGLKAFLLFWDPKQDRIRVQYQLSRRHDTLTKGEVISVENHWPGKRPG